MQLLNNYKENSHKILSEYRPICINYTAGLGITKWQSMDSTSNDIQVHVIHVNSVKSILLEKHPDVIVLGSNLWASTVNALLIR